MRAGKTCDGTGSDSGDSIRDAGATGKHMSAGSLIHGTMSLDHSVNLDTGNRWSAYKHLYKVLSHVVTGRSGGDLTELESILRKHKPDFISLMKNPVSFFPDLKNGIIFAYLP